MRKWLLSGVLSGVLVVAGLNYPGAASPPPAAGEVFTLASSPEGGWTAQQKPRAVYYNGRTYFSWVNGSTGNIRMGVYDHTSQTVTTLLTLDTISSPDLHNAPALLVRESDRKLLVVYCAHDGPNMWLRISTTSLDTDPDLSDGLAASVNLDSAIGGADYTYPQLFQLTGVTDDPIYLFYRDLNASTGRLAFSKVTDAGSGTPANWSARTLVEADSARISYWAAGASTTRIDFLITDGHPYGDDGPVDVGHMYLDGTDDSWHKSDGTTISATKPFGHSEMTQVETDVDGALVFDVHGGTNPIAVYLVDNGLTITARYARWDGAAWDKGDIYTEAHMSVDRYYGYLAINPVDDEEVFSGISTAAGRSELYAYVSADLGATWDSGSAVTTGSGDLNVGVTAIVNGDVTMPIMWLRGELVGSDDFTFGIKGLRRAGP